MTQKWRGVKERGSIVIVVYRGTGLEKKSCHKTLGPSLSV